jgi:hypothetical protein
MTIFEYTKVHIINTLYISKLAFRAPILSFLFIFHHIYHFEKEYFNRACLSKIIFFAPGKILLEKIWPLLEQNFFSFKNYF